MLMSLLKRIITAFGLLSFIILPVPVAAALPRQVTVRHVPTSFLETGYPEQVFPTAETAFQAVIEAQQTDAVLDYYYRSDPVVVSGEWAYADAVRVSRTTGNAILSAGSILLAHRNEDGQWQASLPEDQPRYDLWFDQIPNTLIDDLVKDMSRHQGWTRDAQIAATVSGHYLPWPSPSGARVTTNYANHGLGQIDFAIDVADLWATKDGTIVYVNDSHPDWAHGGSSYATYNNVVVIQHSSTEYTLYLHLRNGSVPGWIKTNCPDGSTGKTCSVSVRRGTKIGEMGNTGWSTGTHLHLSTASSYYVDRNNPDWLDEDNDGDKTELTYTAFTSSHVSADFVEYDYYSVGCETTKTCLQYWPQNDANHKVYSQNGSSPAGACAAPSLIEPTDTPQSNRTITFRWNTVSGCTFTGYEFRLCTSQDITNDAACFVRTYNPETQRIETISGHDNQDLWWGVMATNAPNGSNWAKRHFRIDTSSPPPATGPEVELFRQRDYADRTVHKGTGFYNDPNADSNSMRIPVGWSVRDMARRQSRW